MIDETRIRNNLELISFPRLSGTEGEKMAFNIVKKKIEDLNLKPSVQEFTFTSFYPRIYQKIVFILSFWSLFIFYLNIGEALGIFNVLNMIIILAIFIPIVIITRRPEKIRIGKKKNSQNLYVKILGNSEVSQPDNSPLENDNTNGNLLFVCHLDSKGQRLHMKYRVFLFKWWIISSLCCLIFFFFKNFIIIQFNFWLFLVGAVPLIFNFIIVIMLCFNTTNNESPGAIDNAAGITCVLELLNYYSDPKFRLNNYNLWFLFTGAEETGCQGMRHLYHKIKHLDRTKSFQLNFDTIGTKIDIITGERGAFFFKNTKDFTATIHMIKRIRLSGSDAYILADNGFTGFGVLDIESYKYVHSKDDTVEKVDCSLLEKLLTHITVMLKLVDKSALLK
jgi:hypothetical protein